MAAIYDLSCFPSFLIGTSVLPSIRCAQPPQASEFYTGGYEEPHRVYEAPVAGVNAAYEEPTQGPNAWAEYAAVVPRSQRQQEDEAAIYDMGAPSVGAEALYSIGNIGRTASVRSGAAAYHGGDAGHYDVGNAGSLPLAAEATAHYAVASRDLPSSQYDVASAYDAATAGMGSEPLYAFASNHEASRDSLAEDLSGASVGAASLYDTASPGQSSAYMTLRRSKEEPYLQPSMVSLFGRTDQTDPLYDVAGAGASTVDGQGSHVVYDIGGGMGDEPIYDTGNFDSAI